MELLNKVREKFTVGDGRTLVGPTDEKTLARVHGALQQLNMHYTLDELRDMTPTQFTEVCGQGRRKGEQRLAQIKATEDAMEYIVGDNEAFSIAKKLAEATPKRRGRY
jgi:tryptophan 2,3-dioxygenase